MLPAYAERWVGELSSLRTCLGVDSLGFGHVEFRSFGASAFTRAYGFYGVGLFLFAPAPQGQRAIACAALDQIQTASGLDNCKHFLKRSNGINPKP